jgi:hypothetical protein
MPNAIRLQTLKAPNQVYSSANPPQGSQSESQPLASQQHHVDSERERERNKRRASEREARDGVAGDVTFMPQNLAVDQHRHGKHVHESAD